MNRWKMKLTWIVKSVNYDVESFTAIVDSLIRGTTRPLCRSSGVLVTYWNDKQSFNIFNVQAIKYSITKVHIHVDQKEWIIFGWDKMNYSKSVMFDSCESDV